MRKFAYFLCEKQVFQVLILTKMTKLIEMFFCLKNKKKGKNA